MRWLLAPIVVFYLSTLQAVSQDTDQIDQALNAIQTLCVAYGGAQNRITIDGSLEGGFAIRKFGVGAHANAIVEKADLQGVVAGLEEWVAQLSAEQQDKARDCMSPYLGMIISYILPGNPNFNIDQENAPSYNFSFFNRACGSHAASGIKGFTRLSCGKDFCTIVEHQVRNDVSSNMTLSFIKGDENIHVGKIERRENSSVFLMHCKSPDQGACFFDVDAEEMQALMPNPPESASVDDVISVWFSSPDCSREFLRISGLG